MNSQKLLTTLTTCLVSVLMMTSCSSDDGGGAPAPVVTSLTGIWSISNVQDQNGNVSNMKMEFMSMPYAQYAPTIGQTAPATLPADALAYSKTTATTVNYNYDPYGGYYPGGSGYYPGGGGYYPYTPSQTTTTKKYTMEVGYYTTSNATGIDKLHLYPQVVLTSTDGTTWYNDGGSSAAMSELSYTVNASQLIFHLPDLTNQVWARGAGGGGSSPTPTSTVAGLWQTQNSIQDQSGNTVTMQIELMTVTYLQYTAAMGWPNPTGVSSTALAFVKTAMTTQGWSSYSQTPSYAREIGFYSTANLGGTNKLILNAQVCQTSTDGVNFTVDSSVQPTQSEYSYVVSGNQMTFYLPNMSTQLWSKIR